MIDSNETIALLRREPQTEHTLKQALQEMGIMVPKGILLKEPPESIDIPFPVALKVSDEKLLHKTELGGVKIGIENIEVLRSEINRMKKNFPDSSFLVEEMIQGGIEIIVGLSRNPVFGLSIMLGMGGTMTEIYDDVTFRLIPVQAQDCNDMIDEVSIGRFTGNGFRGKFIDREILIEFMLKISELGSKGSDFIDQFDLNPVKIDGKKLFVLDAKIIKSISKIDGNQ
ncbi:MAG: acetate--CoA ligase family protein [Thermoplasmataceae archaeon]